MLPYSAQAGFNRGDGTGFYALPGSGTSEILALTNTSYVNMSGVWVFRVDGDISIGGLCTVSIDLPNKEMWPWVLVSTWYVCALLLFIWPLRVCTVAIPDDL